MTWIIVAAVAGLAVGGGGVFAFTKDDKPVAPVVVADVSAQKQAEVQVNLSNLDIVKPVCTAEFLKEHGDGLCREMFCLAQANSTTGAATEKTCDAISNLNNTRVILAACGDVADERRRAECFQTFRERK
jgi:hypothetical protein